MVSRGDSFIEYAHEVGATVAGATDTQGEAPKFWVVEAAGIRTMEPWDFSCAAICC